MTLKWAETTKIRKVDQTAGDDIKHFVIVACFYKLKKRLRETLELWIKRQFIRDEAGFIGPSGKTVSMTGSKKKRGCLLGNNMCIIAFGWRIVINNKGDYFTNQGCDWTEMTLHLFAEWFFKDNHCMTYKVITLLIASYQNLFLGTTFYHDQRYHLRLQAVVNLYNVVCGHCENLHFDNSVFER